MRAIGHALLILFVAAVVAAGIYALVGDGVRTDIERGRAKMAADDSDPAAVSSGPGERHGHPTRGRHSREGVSIGRGVAGLVRDVLIMAAITLLVTRVRSVRRLLGLTATPGDKAGPLEEEIG